MGEETTSREMTVKEFTDALLLKHIREIVESEERFKASVVFLAMNVWAIFWFVSGLIVGVFIAW